MLKKKTLLDSSSGDGFDNEPIVPKTTQTDTKKPIMGFRLPGFDTKVKETPQNVPIVIKPPSEEDDKWDSSEDKTTKK